MSDLLTIGEVAKRAGVSVQTLRHYDRLGLLVPTRVSPSGYRLYSEEDCTRLELLRALRGAHFDLDTIAGLLEGTCSPAQAVALQLEVLEMQQRALQRQQVLLRAVSRGASEAILPRLSRLQKLARLGALERETFLATHLKRAMDGQTGHPEVWRAAVEDLPADLTEEGLEAWLELAELVTDAGFQRTLGNQTRPVPGVPTEQVQAWGNAVQALLILGRGAVEEQRDPADAVAQAQLRADLGTLALMMGRQTDRQFIRWFLEYMQSVSDPRMDRYWRLVAHLKGWTYTPVYAQGIRWLLDALAYAASP